MPAIRQPARQTSAAPAPHSTVMRARLNLRPIDDAARDGRYRLLVDGDRFAVGRWQVSPAGGEWAFPGGTPVGFTPSEYQPVERSRT